jgi:hypothetical protein
MKPAEIEEFDLPQPEADAPSRGEFPHVKVHPAAALFPMMTDAELDALAKDIEANGLKHPIVIWTPGNWDDACQLTYGKRPRKRTDIGRTGVDWYVLDGRNRLAALERLGQVKFAADGWPRWCDYGEEGDYGEGDAAILSASDVPDPFAYVISANAHRRHLTAERKSELIEAVIKAKPQASNREIARQTNSDHKTVANKRTKLEARGEIPHVEKRTDSKGRQQPANRKAQLVESQRHADEKIAAAQRDIADAEEAKRRADEELSAQPPQPDNDNAPAVETVANDPTCYTGVVGYAEPPHKERAREIVAGLNQNGRNIWRKVLKQLGDIPPAMILAALDEVEAAAAPEAVAS